MIHFNKKARLLLLLWGIFFVYTIFAGLVYQKVIVSNISSLHAVGSTLSNDALYYNRVAESLALDIKEHGWTHFKLFPSTSASAHVSVLAVAYVIFGNNPLSVLPINAFFHALSGVLIFLITKQLNINQQNQTIVSTISAFLFVMFPSTLNWCAQISKDAYLIAGNLLLVLVWLKVFRVHTFNYKVIWLFLLNIVGIFLVATMRPYVLKVLVLVLLLLMLIMLVCRVFPKTKLIWSFFLLTLCCLLFALLILSHSTVKALTGDGYATEVSAGNQMNHSNWVWKRSDILPSFMDTQFQGLASARVSLSNYGLETNANSMIDINRMPDNSLKLLLYMPRALQIALFAPFPNTWLGDFKLTKLVASIEMLVFYSALVGIVFLMKKENKYEIYFILLFSIVFLVIYGLTISNIGTLYRLRFCYEFLLVLIGLSGWSSIYKVKEGNLKNKLKYFGY